MIVRYPIGRPNCRRAYPFLRAIEGHPVAPRAFSAEIVAEIRIDGEAAAQAC